MNFGAIRQALSNRSVLKAEVGFTAFTLVLHGAWLATVVYAFDQGGTAEAGAVAVGVLAPAAFLSPFVAVWFDRLRPNLALAIGYVAQSVALLLVSASAAADASKFIVYGLVALFAVAQMSARPTISSILPRLVVDPAQLSAANSLTAVVETIGLVLGPALAGLVLFLFEGVSTAFLFCGIAMAAGGLLAITIDTSDTDWLSSDDAPDLEGTLAKVINGFRLLRSDAAPRHLVVALAAMRVSVGVLEVGVVVIAIDHLGRSEAAAGLLGTAIGVGAVFGSILSFAMVGRRRMSLPIALGIACACVPVAAIAVTTNSVVVLGLLALAGLGRPIVEVSGRTLLQGLSTDDMLARIFGLLEGLSLLMLAIGSAMFSYLAVAFGLEFALIVTSLVPVVVVLALYTRIRRIDEQRPEVDPELLTLVRRVPIFAPLAGFRLEQVLVNMRRAEYAPRERVFTQGEAGDDLYIVDRGWAHVDLDDARGIRRGGFFGEIALLRDQPRMATVRAGSEGLTVYRVSRDVFLDAIATAPRSRSRSDRTVERRLGETS